MARFKIYLFCCLFVPAMVCSQGQQTDKLSQINELIASQNFDFQILQATPSSGPSVSLTTIPNHFRIVENKIDTSLPFFGEMRNSSDYNGNGRIVMKGEMKGYEVKQKKTNRPLTIRFEAKGSSGTHRVTINVNPDGWATIIIKSAFRNTISYYGKIRPLEMQS